MWLDKEGIEITTDCCVRKATGEARYEGWVVSTYATKKGALRVVVDVHPQGFQMICDPKLLEVVSIVS
jgi:hypothetical protein